MPRVRLLRPRGSAVHLALAAALVTAALATAARAQNTRESGCRVDYAIEARVDVEEKRIVGDEIVRWRNETRDEVPDLWFHLYWNAFANNRSTFLDEAGGEVRGSSLRDEWGWQRVTSIEVDGVELLPELRWRQPDDARAEDRTVFSVRLPKLAKPGETVTARVQWEARIPRVRRRTGYKDDFLFVVQWFPKLGVYEQGNGWNCHQFHANTEFFADYGSYDVTLDLPARYEGKIGASGVQVEPAKTVDGRVLVRYAAPSLQDQLKPDAIGKSPLVHDFAWTADPDYVAYEATFHYDDWAKRHEKEVERVALALGRGLDELRLRDVAVTVLLQPEHVDQGPRHFDATCTALFFYGLWFGGYPYEKVTVVDPAWGGGAAGGMEYPTLFTAGTRMHTFTEMHSPESVTVHECGHQFWYGLVGNNEFEAGWLDEGFNTYTQNEALKMRYGRSTRTTDFASRPFAGVATTREPGGGAIADALALRKWSLPFGVDLEPIGPGAGLVDAWRALPALCFARGFDDPLASDRNGYLGDPDSDPVDTPGWKYVDRQSYRTNSYRRTATMLRTLAGLVGHDRFLQGMRAYSERWRYAHPYPQDFFQAFNEGAKVDVGWYFDQAFRSTATVDWQIEVSQSRVRAPAGWFPDESGVFVERKKKDDGERAEDEGERRRGRGRDGGDDRDDDRPAPNGWKIDLVVRRKGEFLLPLKVVISFADGHRESLVWSREDQMRSTWWRPLEGRDVSKHKVVSAVIDPDGMYTLDVDLANNRWYAESDEEAPWRWGERVLTQYGHLLHWYGGIGG